MEKNSHKETVYIYPFLMPSISQKNQNFLIKILSRLVGNYKMQKCLFYVARVETLNENILVPYNFVPHLWFSSSELKTGRWEVPGSVPNPAFQPSCSEFFIVFSKTLVNTG